MPALSPEAYAAHRTTWERLALAVEDKSLTDGDYHDAHSRLRRLDDVFAEHWSCVNAARGKASAREQEAADATTAGGGKTVG